MYKNNYNEAEQFYECANYVKALEIFSAINKSKESNDCINYMGCCYLKLDDYEKAISLFEYLIKKYPYWDRPIFNLGRVHLKLGHTCKALEYFKKAIQIDPCSSDGYYYLGIYYQQIEEYDDAIECYTKSLKIEHGQSEAHQNLGVCYSKKGLFRKALEEFNISLSLDSTNADTIYNIGLTHIHLKENSSALDAFLKLYDQSPYDILCIMEIVCCYCKLGDFKKAFKWNDKILHIQPTNEKALLAAKKIKNLIIMK